MRCTKYDGCYGDDAADLKMGTVMKRNIALMLVLVFAVTLISAHAISQTSQTEETTAERSTNCLVSNLGILCAPPGGMVVRAQLGLECGVGQCVKGPLGWQCAKTPMGGAIIGGAATGNVRAASIGAAAGAAAGALTGKIVQENQVSQYGPPPPGGWPYARWAGTPGFFYSPYTGRVYDLRGVPEAFRSRPALQKPFRADALAQALASLELKPANA